MRGINIPMSMLRQAGTALGKAILGSSRDLAPIVVVIAAFQVMILRQPFPEFFSIAMGLVLVVLGLALFVVGLDIGLFPLGEALAEEFARKGSLTWLLVFSFLLGSGTTVAEPALIAITREGARAVSEAGLIPNPCIHCGICDGYPLDGGYLGGRGYRHRRFANPPRMALTVFHFRRLRPGHADDPVCPQRDHRTGLRSRWGDDLDSDRAACDRFGGWARPHHPWSGPVDGWIRPHRLGISNADDFCYDLWPGRALTRVDQRRS